HPDAALHIVVSRLRTSLGAAASRLVSLPAGYRLDVATEELDFTLAQTRFLRGRALLLDHEPDRAAEVLKTALACWTAEPLKDLSAFPFHEEARRQIGELHAAIYEVRNDALLAAGRHVEVLTTIRDALADEPWSERLRAQQLLALYRSGRQVDALREYDSFRRTLINDLGVEPSNELRELHRQVLDHDAALGIERAGIASPLPAWTSLSLPFVGRSDEEELIFARIREVTAGGRHMVLIEGEPGIGKTRLALEIGRRIRDDAIVISATGNDATRPAIVAIADALAQASSQLTDDELRVCIGRWPADVAAIVPGLRDRLPELWPRVEGDEKIRAEHLRGSVASWIVALSQRAPVVVLLDDLHRAGPGLLLLLGRLLVTDEQQRVLVLATARSGYPDRSSKLAHLAQQLEQRDLLDRIRLQGLDSISLERLLSQLGIADPGEKSERLHQSTGGHPFFVGEMLHADGWDSEDAEAPGPVRAFVRRRVRALGIADEETLTAASGFMIGFDIPLLAEVAGLSHATAMAHVDRALDAGLMRQVGAQTFTFVHELTRRALSDALDEPRSGELHRRIALALEKRGAPTGLLATHWRHASGLEAPAKTLRYALATAADAQKILDPDAAALWLDVAQEAAEYPEVQARVLLQLVDAQNQSGNRACVDSLRAAIKLARELDSTDLLVACASVWAPMWSSMPPLEAHERIALLEEAASVARDDGARARLLARLATELLYADQQHRVAGLADAALVYARECNDPAIRVEVALRHFHATWSPHTLAARRASIQEVSALVDDADIVNRSFTLSMTAFAAIEAADLEAADRALAQLFDLADRHGLPVLTFNATAVRAWRVGLAGDLDEAERLVLRSGEQATGQGLHDAVWGMTLQLACITWQRGRFADLLPLLQLMRSESAEATSSRIMTARALAESDADAARTLLASLGDAELGGIAHDVVWVATMITAAEVAFMLELPELGASVRRRIEPFRAQVGFVGNWVLAPIAYGAAVAGAAAGHTDVDALFEQSLEISDRLHAPVLRARTETARARAAERLERAPARIETT
ncbi:MAG: BTAD domain-containing putative transcriptional regulator, partial [Actinomycetota bacterium]